MGTVTDYDILGECVQNTTLQNVMLLYEDLVYRDPFCHLQLYRFNE
jgi:hypothetical protein